MNAATTSTAIFKLPNGFRTMDSSSPPFTYKIKVLGRGSPRPRTAVELISPKLCSLWRRGGLFLKHCQANSYGGEGGMVDSDTSPELPIPFGIEALKNTSTVSPGDGYVGLFVRMLGLDNDPLDRQHAIIELWKYSQGGKHCIDTIMQFPGTINLCINLLKSDSSSTSEAAAGLLRIVSSVNSYRALVAEAGAVEEIDSLLSRSVMSSEVKEQIICLLWNLSVDEELRVKIANTDLLPALIKFLDDEEIKVKEAAGGVLANLALSQCNHSVMVEAGIIPKLVEILRNNVEGSKLIRKEAKSVLLELAKDKYYRILIVEDGLVPVPIIGAAAYKSFKSVRHSWPSLPDGTEFERRSSNPSRFGASELLLGLNIEDRNRDLDDAKMKAIVGRSQQQFLARIGAIEMEEGRKPELDSSQNQRFTLLPWMDGVARLVLILGLDDVSSIERAARSIADASINEHMRVSFKEAGAVNHLVRLLARNNNETLRLSVAHALERLSISYEVCQEIEAHGVVDPLVDILRNVNTSQSLMEKIVNLLAQIFDPGRELKTKFQGGTINGSEEALNAEAGSSTEYITGLEEILGGDKSMPKEMNRKKLLYPGVISRFIEILKTATPSLQQKTASILEDLAISERYATAITIEAIRSGLDAVFRRSFMDGIEENTELNPVEAEEAGLAISAASRLLTKLLSFEQCCHTIDCIHFTHVLRIVLKSNIPLHAKDWVAACLIKLESLVGSQLSDLEKPINVEVTIHETIPRLVESMRTAFSSAEQEAAVIQLDAIISEEGMMEYARAAADRGAIFPLVKLIEQEGASERAQEAGIAILYKLSMDSENHSAIIAAGAVPVLRRVVLSQGPHWMRALALLRTLPT